MIQNENDLEREKVLKLTTPCKTEGLLKVRVGPLGLEPRLFGTKNQRVASYTMGQSHIEGANL